MNALALRHPLLIDSFPWSLVWRSLTDAASNIDRPPAHWFPSLLRMLLALPCLVHAIIGQAAPPGTAGSAFDVVHEAVFSNPYQALPQYRVDLSLLGRSGDGNDNHFRAAARRTLASEADLLDFPHGQKLLQPNGICFSGEWRIGPGSPWTGLLAPGTQVHAIARVSVALSETTQDARRAVGMAVKLFPHPATTHADARTTRNLFVLESVSGRRLQHALDAVMDNAPPLGSLPGLSGLRLALRLRADLLAADRASGASAPDFAFRPVDHLAAAVDGSDGPARAPRWIRLQVPADIPRVDAADFRDELRLANYPGGELGWRIEAAADTPGGKEAAAWQSIGTLRLTESITSPGCDRRLHFAHPRLRGKP